MIGFTEYKSPFVQVETNQLAITFGFKPAYPLLEELDIAIGDFRTYPKGEKAKDQKHRLSRMAKSAQSLLDDLEAVSPDFTPFLPQLEHPLTQLIIQCQFDDKYGPTNTTGEARRTLLRHLARIWVNGTGKSCILTADPGKNGAGSSEFYRFVKSVVDTACIFFGKEEPGAALLKSLQRALKEPI